jgi:hypothetical protein
MKTNKPQKSVFNSKNINSSFTGTQLTRYAGLSPIMKYINKIAFGQQLNELFPTRMYNSSKFTTVQIMLSVVLSCLVGVNRLSKIAAFSRDSLVMALLGLKKGLNKDVISVRLKQLGQAGAIKLQQYLLELTSRWLTNSQLTRITLDADSTVKTVYGHQQGAAKGYNPHKPGALSYHPLLAFVSELKLVINSWFRTGSAYTSNGIGDFISQTKAVLPSSIQEVLFRADSGFFSGSLFDQLESYHWTYLVKVKLKNLKQLLQHQTWQPLTNDPNIASCQFSYQAKKWKKSRTLKAVRVVTQWIEVEFMGETQLAPQYEYACYCSNLADEPWLLHQLYNQRSTSENWIEQVKNQLLAGATLTDNFYANDLLWQLSIFAYNLSVIMRTTIKTIWQQEHATFRDWFINLPAKLVHGGCQITMKIYEHYYYKSKWLEFERALLL